MFVVITILHRIEGHTAALVGMELLVEIEKSEDIPSLLDAVRVCGGRVVNIRIDDESETHSEKHLQVQLSLKVARGFEASRILTEMSKRISINVFKEL